MWVGGGAEVEMWRCLRGGGGLLLVGLGLPEAAESRGLRWAGLGTGEGGGLGWGYGYSF